MMHIFMHGHVVDKNIIKVYWNKFSYKRSKNTIHNYHESVRSCLSIQKT